MFHNVSQCFSIAGSSSPANHFESRDRLFSEPPSLARLRPCLFYSSLISVADLMIFLFRAFTTSPSCDEFGSDGNLLTTRGQHSGSESFLVSGAGEGEEEEEVYENQPTIMATSNGRPPSRPPPPLSRPPGVRPVQFGPSPTGPPPSMAPPPVPQSPAGSRKLSLQPQYTRAPEPLEPGRQFKFGETKLRSPSPSRNTVSRNGTVERKVTQERSFRKRSTNILALSFHT